MDSHLYIKCLIWNKVKDFKLDLEKHINKFSVWSGGYDGEGLDEIINMKKGKIKYWTFWVKCMVNLKFEPIIILTRTFGRKNYIF